MSWHSRLSILSAVNFKWVTVALLAVIHPTISVAADITAEWLGGDGIWTDANQWSSTGFPNNTQSQTYDVQLGSGTINLDTSAVINGLFQSGGTITASAGGTTLFLNDDSQWSGGTFDRNVLFFMQPVTWTLDGGAKTFSGGAQLLYGEGATVTTNWTSGDITLSGGSVWRNAAGGTFRIQNFTAIPFVMQGDSQSSFINQGLVQAGRADINVRFDNHGSFTTGETVNFNGGGSHTGDFLVGGSLKFSGDHTFSGASVTESGAFSRVEFAAGSVHFDSASNYHRPGTIISGAHVVFDNNAQMRALTLSAGSLSGAGAVEINNGQSHWTGGAMSGSGATLIHTFGGLTLSGGTKSLSRTLEIYRSAAWTEGNIEFAGGTLRHGGSFPFLIETDSDMLSVSGTNLFHNQGTVRKQNSNNVTRIEPAFDNDGSLEINSGVIQLAGGGTSGGQFIIGPSGGLQFDGGTHTLTGGSISGAEGLAEITGGVVSLDADSNLNMLVLSLDGGELAINSGTNSANTFLMSGGKLTGAGTLTTTHTGDPASQWSGGEMHDGTTQFADVTFSGGDKQLFGRTLLTTATTHWTEGDIHFGEGTHSGAPSSWINSGTLNILANDEILSDGGAHSFTNQGTITREDVIGSTGINVAFNNHGVFDVRGGAVVLGDGGTSSGTFEVAEGATLWFSGGDHALTGNARLTGDGNVQVRSNLTVGSGVTYDVLTTQIDDGATLTLNNNATTGRLWLTDGALAGIGTLTVSGDNSRFGESVMSGAGTTTFAGSLAIDGLAVVSDGRTVETQGDTTLEFGRELFLGNGGTWNNSGNFVIERQAEISAGGGNQFVNSGTLSKASTVADTTTIAPAFTNSGTVEVTQAATLDFTGGYTQTGGTLSLVNGGSVASPLPLAIQGGTIQGRGSIQAAVDNLGTIRPDLQPLSQAAIHINGDLTLGSGSLLDLSFGLSGGNLHQRAIDVSGALTAAGNLQLGLGGADSHFRVGDTFTLATAGGGISGAFNNFASGAVFSEGEVLANIHYGAGSPFDANSLIFEVTQAAPLTAIWNGSNSNWTNAGAWSTTEFPNNVAGGDRYNAAINSGRVTLNQDIEVTGLSLASHLFPANNSTLTITDEWNWTGGHINKSGDGGALVSQGLFTLTSSDAKIEVPLTNSGDAQFVGRGISLHLGATFTNEGVLHVVGREGASSYRVFSGGAVNNTATGLIEIDTGAAADFNGGTFHNAGTLRVSSGDFALDNVVSGTSNGQIEVAGGSTFTINIGEGRRYDINGTLIETGGPATFYKDGRGGVRLRSGSTYGLANMIIHEGAVIMDEPATIVNLELHSRPGIRSGSADVHVTGHLDWQGGRFGGSFAGGSGLGDTGGTTILDPGSTTLISTTADKTISNHTLINRGTVTYERGQVSISGGGSFTNEGTLNAVGDGAASSYRIFSGSTVTNAASGLMAIDTGTAADFNGGTFHNAGTLRVSSGDFALSNVVSGTSSGQIELAGGSTFTIDIGEGRRYDIAGTLIETGGPATFNTGGRGAVRLRPGSTYQVTNTIVEGTNALMIQEPTTLVNLTLNTGILNGGAEAHVTGHFDWIAGRFGGGAANSSLGNDGGTTILDPGSTSLLETGSDKRIFNHALINHGELVWQAGFIGLDADGRLENHGLFDVRFDGRIGSASAFGFINTGTITKSAGTGESRIEPTVTSTGTVAVDSGTLWIDKLIQNGGSTQVAADATLLSFNRIDINGGSIGGAGTVQGHLRVRGELTPGASVGQLNVNGDLEFSGSPTYLWELDAAGGDLVHVTGNLIFGTGVAPVLDISHFGGDLSATHTILTYDGAAPTNQPAWTIQAAGASGPITDAHFINPAGGAWDEADNWDTPATVTGGNVVYSPGALQVTGVTVGRNAPAAGVNIFIDADGDYTVTGPAAGIDAENLTVGAATSGLAELRLTSADDTVRGTTTIGPRGLLSLQDSTLELQGPLHVAGGGSISVSAGGALSLADTIQNDGVLSISGELQVVGTVTATGAGRISSANGTISSSNTTESLRLGENQILSLLGVTQIDTVNIDGTLGGEIEYRSLSDVLNLTNGAQLQNISVSPLSSNRSLTINASDAVFRSVSLTNTTVNIDGDANDRLVLQGVIQKGGSDIRLDTRNETGRAEVELIGQVTLTGNQDPFTGRFGVVNFLGSGDNVIIGHGLTNGPEHIIQVQTNSNGTIVAPVTNQGKINLVTGSHLEVSSGISSTGPVVIHDAQLVTPHLIIRPGGSLTGTGQVLGNIHNLGGYVAPGFSPGVIEVFGDYIQDADGVLEMELAGTGDGQFDVLQVSGDIDLQGTILLSFIDGFAPSQGDVFQFMIGDEVIDFSQAAFQVMNLEPGFAYDLNSIAGVLQMTALNDGVSQTAANLVPEPRSAAIALVAGLMLLLSWRRRRRHAP